jgi:ethanolamine utilization protein EutN
MELARVEGSVTSSLKEARLTATKLLIVQPVGPEAKPAAGAPYLAVDTVGAGEGDVVIVVRGTPASRAVSPEGGPVDAAIVGIVDSTRFGGRLAYHKE